MGGEPSDETLYHKVRRGDLQAFDTLYARYERRLFGFICKMVHNHHDAEDLFHEAFVSVLRSREVSFDRGNFCGWLYRIARNQCLNHLRSGRRASLLSHRAEEPCPPPSAETTVAEGERAVLLQQAVTMLPPLLSEIYHLRSAGLAYEEMAEVLQIPLGTVKSRMNQMTQRLRDDLARRLGGPARPDSPDESPASLSANAPSVRPPILGESAEPEKEYPAHELRRY